MTPSFVARAWLGQQYVAEQTFDGRTTDRAAALVPMAELDDAVRRILTLKEEMGLSNVQLGIVAGAFMWVYAAFGPIAGSRWRRPTNRPSTTASAGPSPRNSWTSPTTTGSC